MQLKTCYGLCTLRTGVRIVATYELLYTTILLICIVVNEVFSKHYPLNDDVNLYYFLLSCIVIIALLKIYSSVSLIQATFRNAPYKIFQWIVVACIGYAAGFVISAKAYVYKMYVGTAADQASGSDELECTLLLTFILMNLVSVVELHVVASYHGAEKRLEEAEHRTRVQNLIASHRSAHSLDRHRPDVFYYGGSSMLRRGQAAFFSSFKGRPSYRFDVPAANAPTPV